MNDNEQILKGLLDTLVLDALCAGPNYGFGILQNLRERMGEDAAIFKESTLYPLLHRLEKRELLTSFRQPGQRGTPRKYYQITALGKTYLASRVEEWRRVALLLQRTILENPKETP